MNMDSGLRTDFPGTPAAQPRAGTLSASGHHSACSSDPTCTSEERLTVVSKLTGVIVLTGAKHPGRRQPTPTHSTGLVGCSAERARLCYRWRNVPRCARTIDLTSRTRTGTTERSQWWHATLHDYGATKHTNPQDHPFRPDLPATTRMSGGEHRTTSSCAPETLVLCRRHIDAANREQLRRPA
jgi:hypothetical protein